MTTYPIILVDSCATPTATPPTIPTSMTMCSPQTMVPTYPHRSQSEDVSPCSSDTSSSEVRTSLLPGHQGNGVDHEEQEEDTVHDFPLIEWSDDAENDNADDPALEEEEEAYNASSSTKNKRQSNENLYSMMMCKPRKRRRRSASAPVDLNHIYAKLNVNMKRQNPHGSLLRSLKFTGKLDSLATTLDDDGTITNTTPRTCASWTANAFISHFDDHDHQTTSSKRNYQWPSISTSPPPSLKSHINCNLDLFKALEELDKLTITYNKAGRRGRKISDCSR